MLCWIFYRCKLKFLRVIKKDFYPQPYSFLFSFLLLLNETLNRSSLDASMHGLLIVIRYQRDLLTHRTLTPVSQDYRNLKLKMLFEFVCGKLVSADKYTMMDITDWNTFAVFHFTPYQTEHEVQWYWYSAKRAQSWHVNYYCTTTTTPQLQQLLQPPAWFTK